MSARASELLACAAIAMGICGAAPRETLASAAQGQQATASPDDQVRAWFDRAWAEAQEYPAFGEFIVRWRTEDHETLRPAELASLRREIAGHPEHPMRQELPRLERHAAGDFTVLRFMLAARGEGRWRYGITFADGSFNDIVLMPSSSWWMSKETLKVFNRAEVDREDPEQMVGIHDHSFVPVLGRLIHGNLSLGRTAQMDPGRLHFANGRWKIRLSRGDHLPPEQRIAYEITGRWDAGAGRGFVERSTIAENGYKPEAVGARNDFKDWTFVGSIGRWVAGSVEERKADGTLGRVIFFEDAHPIPEGGFAALAKTPDRDSQDPIRGRVAFAHAADFRSRTVDVFDAQGRIASGAMDQPGSPRANMRNNVRYAGWGLIAIACSTGFLLVRRRLLARTLIPPRRPEVGLRSP